MKKKKEEAEEENRKAKKFQRAKIMAECYRERGRNSGKSNYIAKDVMKKFESIYGADVHTQPTAILFSFL